MKITILILLPPEGQQDEAPCQQASAAWLQSQEPQYDDGTKSTRRGGKRRPRMLPPGVGQN